MRTPVINAPFVINSFYRRGLKNIPTYAYNPLKYSQIAVLAVILDCCNVK